MQHITELVLQSTDFGRQIMEFKAAKKKIVVKKGKGDYEYHNENSNTVFCSFTCIQKGTGI